MSKHIKCPPEKTDDQHPLVYINLKKSPICPYCGKNYAKQKSLSK